MTKPVLMIVDDGSEDLRMVETELVQRYAAAYDIRAELSPDSSLQHLAALTADAAEVIILFAALQASTMTTFEFLRQAHHLHPHADRVALIPLGNRSATRPMLKAVTLGQIDHFTTKPTCTPDETLHALVTSRYTTRVAPSRTAGAVIARPDQPSLLGLDDRFQVVVI